MSTIFFGFPSHEDWKRIYNDSPFDRLFSLLDSFQNKGHASQGIDGFTKAIELHGLIYEVQQRLSDVRRSYILMMFYYKQGIPDQRWYISPGRNGESVQYYPDFEERHFHIKGWFDYYSDTLYYKLFSAWDVVGHILNVKYDLKVDMVYFGKAVEALKSKHPSLHANFAGVRESPVFKKASTIRNDITHNYLPNTAGMAVYRGSKSTTVGLKKYVPSDEIIANVQEILELFALA